MSTPRLYPASVTGVHDGDSVTVTVSLGFQVYISVTVRLAGINAQELALPGGKEARDHLLGLMPLGSSVSLISLSYDKFGGRTDGRIILSSGVDVAQQMVLDGYAVVWDGKGPRPVPPWPIPAPAGNA